MPNSRLRHGRHNFGSYKKLKTCVFIIPLDTLRNMGRVLQYVWQPTLSSNPISWIVWHMARVEDRWINRVLCGSFEIWSLDGWYKKFGMSKEAYGYGDTLEQVRAMPDVAVSELLEYFDAVRQPTLECLEQMTPAKLASTYDHPRFTSITGAWILGHLLFEESQHLGQVVYIRGMIRSQNP